MAAKMLPCASHLADGPLFAENNIGLSEKASPPATTLVSLIANSRIFILWKKFDCNIAVAKMLSEDEKVSNTPFGVFC